MSTDCSSILYMSFKILCFCQTFRLFLGQPKLCAAIARLPFQISPNGLFHPAEKGIEKKIGEPLFSISSRGRLRNRTKSKFIGFSKTARWISMKIKVRGHFSILFQLRLSKAWKSKFEKNRYFENFVYLYI